MNPDRPRINHAIPISAQNSAPRWPCGPCYNLHTLGRWVACTVLYCFQLPTAGGSREACKPDDEPASRITECGLKEGPSRTPQGTFLFYASITGEGTFFPVLPSERTAAQSSPPSSSSSSEKRRSMKRSYTSFSSSSVSRVESSSSPFSTMDFRMTSP